MYRQPGRSLRPALDMTGYAYAATKAMRPDPAAACGGGGTVFAPTPPSCRWRVRPGMARVDGAQRGRGLQFLDTIPLAGWAITGEQDIGDTLVQLCSDACSYINARVSGWMAARPHSLTGAAA